MILNKTKYLDDRSIPRVISSQLTPDGLMSRALSWRGLTFFLLLVITDTIPENMLIGGVCSLKLAFSRTRQE